MAGRGTDIRLGGSDEADHDRVAELGGLHVVGTGRHHTERLDNQLRGRAGRQGDPGSSVFFSSWEDDVVAANLDDNKLPMETDEDGRIVSPKAAGLLDHAQRVAEGRMLDVHANTWRYNQLIAQQRAIIVDRRNTLLRTATAREELAELAPSGTKELSKTSPRIAWRPSAGRSCCITSTAAGPIIWLTWPTSGKASTCVRWAGRTRWTNSTGWRSTRSRRWPRTRSRLRSRRSRPPTSWKRNRAWICQAGPADVDVDLHGQRQPAVGRHAFHAEPARGLPLDRRRLPDCAAVRAAGRIVVGLRSRLMEPALPPNRVLTVPNALSALRLVLIAVFTYALLGAHANGWAVGILMFSGASDWADGKIARLLNQSSRLGVLLDPAVDRLYMVCVPVVMAMSGIVPWWFVAVLLARDGVLAATLPLLWSRGCPRCR